MIPGEFAIFVRIFQVEFWEHYYFFCNCYNSLTTKGRRFFLFQLFQLKGLQGEYFIILLLVHFQIPYSVIV